MVTVMIIFQKYHLSERDYQTGSFFGNSTDISVKAGEIIFHDVSMQKKILCLVLNTVIQVTKELGQIVYKSSMMTHDSDRLFLGVPISNDKAMEAVNRLLKEERIITQYKIYFPLLENRKMEGTL